VGFFDGGWWPRSWNLAAELPGLLAALCATGYHAHRVTYNLTARDPPPHTLAVPGQVVKLDGYRGQDPAVIGFLDIASSHRVDLLVIPPDIDPGVAERALVLAGGEGDMHRAREILQPGRYRRGAANDRPDRSSRSAAHRPMGNLRRSHPRRSNGARSGVSMVRYSADRRFRSVGAVPTEPVDPQKGPKDPGGGGADGPTVRAMTQTLHKTVFELPRRRRSRGTQAAAS